MVLRIEGHDIALAFVVLLPSYNLTNANAEQIATASVTELSLSDAEKATKRPSSVLI